MAAVPPEYAARVAKEIAEIYSDAAARMLGRVARRLEAGVDRPGWAEQKLSEIVHLRDAAIADLERLQVLGPEAAGRAVTDAYTAGRAAAANDLSIGAGTFTGTNQAAVRALAEETVGLLGQTHARILRTTLDAYRSVIAETSVPGVVTGTESRRQAAQSALNRFADRGVTGFVDAAGRRWELESYVEMATRTGASKAMIGGRLDGYVAAGRDLVIVSDAPEECSRCRQFEGKVLSISGQSTGTLDRGFAVAGTVSMATSAGLFHPGCRHDLRPYIAGVTRPFGHTADPAGDRARQEQRRLERGVRQWKRREVVAITPDADALAKRKQAEWQARLRQHVEANDLKRLRYREQIGSAR